MNNSSDSNGAPVAQPQKFLRYRSVRKTLVDTAQSQQPPPPLPPPPTVPEIPQASLSRLPSRYHRRPKPAADSSAPPLPGVQQHNGREPVANVPPINRPNRANTAPNNAIHDRKQGCDANGRTNRDRSEQSSRSTPRSDRRHDAHDDHIPEDGTEPYRRSYELAREEARLILEGEYDRLKALRAQESKRRKEQQTRREQAQREQAQREEADRQQKAEAARLAARELEDDSDKSTSEHVEPTASSHASSAQKATTEGRGQGVERQPTKLRPRNWTLSRSPRVERSDTATSSADEQSQPSRSTVPSPPVATPPKEAQASLPSAPLAFDAPVSAVNSGERRVGVKCNKSLITLPITPSTTCKDILNSASNCMSEPIDPRTAVLVESFSQLGLERPLRRYERARDVMNAWDNDSENLFMIMSASESAAKGLTLEEVPSQQPTGTSVQIYHSLKPGKWEKRWLVLRDDGQVLMGKREDGLDAAKTCHLSDFDVYTPTARQIQRLKAPRKLCFALKSQQKSSMFQTGANFVHYFCTKDKEIADRWYQAVHSWRSWYLVNALGEGQEKRGNAKNGIHLDSRPATGDSKETTPYVLGSFKPLLDFGFSRPSEENELRPTLDFLKRPAGGPPRPLLDLIPGQAGTSDGRNPGSPHGSFGSNHGRPPSSYPRKNTIDSGPSHRSDEADGPFTGTGLLARSASRRTQGGNRSGRGVAGIEGKPLVDLTITSEFTDGSLLRKVEALAAQQGALGPKIDRQKRRERSVTVGEGL